MRPPRRTVPSYTPPVGGVQKPADPQARKSLPAPSEQPPAAESSPDRPTTVSARLDAKTLAKLDRLRVRTGPDVTRSSYLRYLIQEAHE